MDYKLLYHELQFELEFWRVACILMGFGSLILAASVWTIIKRKEL